GSASIVYHHRVFHIGGALYDGRLLVRIWNTRPVVRQPVERMLAEAHHVVIVGGRVVERGLYTGTTVRRIIHDDTRGVPVVVIADGEGHVGDVACPEVPCVRWF